MSGPFAAAELGLPDSVPCAFCQGEDTELHSPFGSQLSVATYWCRACHTAFEWFKWGSGPTAPAAGASGGIVGPRVPETGKK